MLMTNPNLPTFDYNENYCLAPMQLPKIDAMLLDDYLRQARTLAYEHCSSAEWHKLGKMRNKVPYKVNDIYFYIHERNCINNYCVSVIIEYYDKKGKLCQVNGNCNKYAIYQIIELLKEEQFVRFMKNGKLFFKKQTNKNGYPTINFYAPIRKKGC